MKGFNILRCLSFIGIIVLSFFTTSSFAETQEEGYRVNTNTTKDVISIAANGEAVAVLKKGGSVVTFGDKRFGGDPSYSSDFYPEIAAANGDITKRVISIVTTDKAFAALKKGGSVVSWGDKRFGGDPNFENEDIARVNGDITKGVMSIVANGSAFAALKKDGSVVTWGNRMFGGDPNYEDKYTASAKEGLDNVISIVATERSAFTALKADGSVVTWGRKESGEDSSYEDKDTTSTKEKLTKVISVVLRTNVYAILKENGSVITWGDDTLSGLDSNYEDIYAARLDNVISVDATDSAFAAIKKDGSVVTWGNKYNGGDPSFKDEFIAKANGDLTKDVISIVATDGAFAALKQDGSVVSWGNKLGGADPNLENEHVARANGDLTKDVISIVATKYAFSALKNDGTVVTWGAKWYGGDPSYEDDNIARAKEGLDHVISIVATCGRYNAFAALKEDGSVVTWGHRYYGGDPSFELVDEDNGEYVVKANRDLSKDVVSIAATSGAFVALKKDGSVVSWGNRCGGDPSYEDKYVAKANGNLTDVISIVANTDAFAALKEDGSVVSWGSKKFGGDPSFECEDKHHVIFGNSPINTYKTYKADGDLSKDVISITTNGSAFTVVKKDGSVVTWGWIPTKE